jgi:uncharacterized OB-fold protein
MSAPRTSADTALPYWERTRHLGFALPRCQDCGRFHFYPRPACPFCGASRITEAPASGRGQVYSHSTVYRAPGPAFAAEVPYTVAIVALDEGPHLLTRIVDSDPQRVRIGMRVRLAARGDDPRPLFKPDEPEEQA